MNERPQELQHLCIIANRSSVVRVLLGDVMMSSSILESSVTGDSELSLGVESVEHIIPVTGHVFMLHFLHSDQM